MSIQKHTVHFDLPRNIEKEYRTTFHFMEKLKYRTNPEPSEDIVYQCMENGEFKTTHISNRYIVEEEIGGITWWLIVEINDEAFTNENKYHALVSIYAPDDHPEDHKTVFEADIE